MATVNTETVLNAPNIFYLNVKFLNYQQRSLNKTHTVIAVAAFPINVLSFVIITVQLATNHFKIIKNWILF